MAEIEGSSWQTKFSTLRERVEYAFNNSLFCDIEFTVDESNGNRVAVSANKFILSVSSPVFETMFQGKLAEQGPRIHLPDCTKDGLQEMLRFLHSDVVNLTGSNVMEVLYLADKYMLPFLEKRCYEYLANELSPGDVFNVLPETQQSNKTRAEELCWNVVDFQTHQAVTSKAFLNISSDLLRQVLERETLSTDEVNLFNAVNRWASNRIEDETKKENGCEKRSVLGDEIVHLIRFPVMTQEEFAGDVLIRDILHEREVTEVVQIFSSIEPLQTSFKAVKRKGQWDEIWTENRFHAIDARYSNFSGTQTITFVVNKSIFLAGVRLFASNRPSDVEETLLSIENSETDFELYSTRLNPEVHKRVKIDDCYFGYTVMIKPPVFLLPMEKYSVKVNMKMENYSNMYVGSRGKKEICYQDIKVKFIDSNDSVNPGTTSEYGQFPSLLLKRKVLLEKRVVNTK